MCLRKSNLIYAPRFFLWRRVAPLTRCPSLCFALASPLFRAQRFVHSPAVYFLLLAVFSRCPYLFFSVRPTALFRRPLLTVAGVGPSAAADGCGVGVCRILLSGYVGLSRTRGHPCQLGCAPARFLFLFHTHSRPLPALVPFSLLSLLAYAFSQPSRPSHRYIVSSSSLLSIDVFPLCHSHFSLISVSLHRVHLYQYRLFFSRLRLSLPPCIFTSGSRPFCCAMSSGRPSRLPRGHLFPLSRLFP